MTAQLKTFRLRDGELFCFNHVLVMISVALEYDRLGDIGWLLAMILTFIGCKKITQYMNIPDSLLLILFMTSDYKTCKNVYAF